MDKSQIVDTLKRLIAEDLDLDVRYEQIQDGASFLEDGLALDSISMAEFINHLERRFPIRVLDEDLESDTFSSLDSVAALVLRRLSERTDEVACDE